MPTAYPKILNLPGPRPYSPQYTIVLGPGRQLKFVDGRVEVANKAEETAVREALAHDGYRVYENDSQTPLKVPGLTGWVTYSSGAYAELLTKLPPIVR